MQLLYSVSVKTLTSSFPALIRKNGIVDTNYLDIYVCMCVCVHVCMWVCGYVCMCGGVCGCATNLPSTFIIS